MRDGLRIAAVHLSAQRGKLMHIARKAAGKESEASSVNPRQRKYLIKYNGHAIAWADDLEAASAFAEQFSTPVDRSRVEKNPAWLPTKDCPRH
jgi:hypothetical protein